MTPDLAQVKEDPQASGLGPTERRRREGKILVFVSPHYWVNPQDHEELRARVEQLETQVKALSARTGAFRSNGGR